MATTKVSTKLLETVGVAEGGTGATSTSAARTSLGLVIGTNVLAPNGSGSSLTGIATGATDAEAANIMLNAFRISVVGSLTKQNMVDGVVDEFEDETGIDTSTSTNEAYSSSGDLYEPTNNSTTEDGGHTRTGTGSGGQTVFDQTWVVNNSTTIKKFSIYESTSGYSGKFKIGLENSSTNIDIVVSEPFTHTGSGWETFDFTVASSYIVPASGTYRAGLYSTSVRDSLTYTRAYYVGDATGSSETYISGNGTLGALIRVHYAGAINNMTLVSNATTALATPTDANIVIWQEDVDSVTLNTDLKAYASRDGTTYTQMTLSEVASLTTGRILTGTVDISGQSSATAMKYKIETLNTKEQKIHAVALQWS